MNLKYLKDQELDQSFQISVRKEREALTEILNHIVEVEKRKLYLKMCFPSLFVYLTEHLKYSNGTAQRRIDAARLMKDFPALPEKLESGELNLGQVSIVQKALRQKKKELKTSNLKDGDHAFLKLNSTSLSREAKTELIESLIGRSEKESEVLVSKALDLEIKDQPKIHHQKDESVRFEVTLTKAQWKKLNRMRELFSTSLPDGSWDQVLERAADQIIEKKTKVTERAKPSQDRLKETTKKIVRNRDEACVICNSKWNLHTDHIHPLWDSGTHELENLQVLCAAHNQQRYKDQAWIRPQ